MNSRMATIKLPLLFGDPRVAYECSCGIRRPLTRTYFCRHCLRLRCRDCVSHEVDSQYCQHCLEYIPTIDAKLKRNRCSSCFQCPSCCHTLSTRAFITQSPSESDPNQITQKKTFLLICGFCRWTSKDVGIPDQVTASGGWPEHETPNAKRLEGLFDYYRMVAQREKLEKEKKRMNPRTGHAIHLLDKYGISASLSPKVTETLRAKLYGRTSSGGLMANLKSPTDCNLVASIASEDAEPLRVEDYYGKDLEVNEMSSIEQRLVQVELQPEKVADFHPVSQMLSVKRSLRCKECEHNLSKPEYNPSSIKFKIQLAAYYHVPEVKIKSVPRLEAGIQTKIELTIQNPTPYKLHLTLLPDTDGEGNADLILPTKELVLPPKDDTVELDVELEQKAKHSTDDPSIVSFRRGNKLGVIIAVIPKGKEANVRICFRMKHDFINSVIQVQGTGEREAQVSWVEHKVILNLGSSQSPLPSD